ncbi:MAG: polyhydroxyalkanoic acid system family protein [Chitinophagaceae bacterium]|nr:polyhydroxyalkanoic acid system family protein [Chitinophagaceae bacterium]
MPNIEMSIPHSLGQQEALDRIQKLLGNVQDRFSGQLKDVQQNWNGNEGSFSFSVMNMPVSGKLTVNNGDVALDGKLPLAASLFQGKIKEVIMEEAKKVLS